MIASGRATVTTLVRSSVSRSAASSLVVTVTGAALSAALHVLLARVLPLPEYGAYAYAITWANVVVLVGRGGFDKSAVRFLPRFDATGDADGAATFRRFSRRFSLVVSAAAAGVSALALLAFGGGMDPLRRNALLAALLLAPPLAVLNITASHVRAARRAALSVGPEAIGVPVLSGAAVGILAAAGVGLTAPIAASLTALATVVVAAGLHGYARTRLESGRAEPVDPETRRLWVAASVQLALGGAAALVLNTSDVVVLGALAAPEDVARYAVAAKVALTISLLPNAVGLILAPTLAHALGADDRDRAQRLLTMSTRLTLAATALAAAILALAGRPVLGVFGAEYRTAYSVLLILLAGQVLFAAAGPSEVALTVSESPATLTKVFAVAGAANVALCVVLVPPLGPAGAAIAFSTVRVAQTHVARLLVRRHMGLTTGPLGQSRPA